MLPLWGNRERAQPLSLEPLDPYDLSILDHNHFVGNGLQIPGTLARRFQPVRQGIEFPGAACPCSHRFSDGETRDGRLGKSFGVDKSAGYRARLATDSEW